MYWTNIAYVRMRGWVHISQWGRLLKKKKKKVIALLWKCCRWLSGLFCDPPLPWDRLNFAWNELGHSGLLGLSDCYCCWLMASSQPCLLSAGLSSKMDVIIVCLFFFLSSQSLTLLTCQTLRLGKFLSSLKCFSVPLECGLLWPPPLLIHTATPTC